ncbi:uncharacterized protein LOC108443139 [Pygocentrus nattereri]|uniref:uncharacterized protein LOC108443139 n=1 Tax=Pygocentrus nattereri TaxID=42514 RepID=UPI0008145EA2|nr:uncharacterized protein LOC108443139 [Pygocentrus nattereri]
MVLLPLLVCVVLRALGAQAKVVTDFAECNVNFYRTTEPSGMDQTAKKICQKYKGSFYYATLYSTHHRIPLYSAYTFNKVNLQDGDRFSKPSQWFIEPQLNFSPGSWGSDMIKGDLSPEEMQVELQVSGEIGSHQAVESDYKYTKYDCGHLNPTSFHSSEDRLPTFTLTNAVPMDPCLNRVHWWNWEAELKKLLKEELEHHPKGTAYVITGTVPHPNYRIPEREEADQEERLGFERVTVPTHIWTAVCFEDRTDEDNPYLFSFGYIGVNRPETTITVRSVPELNSDLTELYRTASGQQGSEVRTEINIFTGDCNIDKRPKNVMEKLSEKQLSDEVSKFFRLPFRSTKRETIADVQHDSNLMFFDNILSFFQESERMKRETKTACLLIKVDDPKSKKAGQQLHDDYPVQCRQVPEKSTPGSLISANGNLCLSDKHFCETEGGYTPSCTTPCLFQEDLKGYWCFSGKIQIQCSPQYSAITTKGEKCKNNHPCGTYGYGYYWCYTEAGSWGYCSSPFWKTIAVNGKSCRPNFACGTYGESYTWCYTDYHNNWSKCNLQA